MLKIACPRCYWATDDVDITIGQDHVGYVIKCKKADCGAEYLMKTPLISCDRLVAI